MRDHGCNAQDEGALRGSELSAEDITYSGSPLRACHGLEVFSADPLGLGSRSPLPLLFRSPSLF